MVHIDTYHVITYHTLVNCRSASAEILSSSSSRIPICKARLHTRVSQTRLRPYAHSNSQLFRLRLNCSWVLALRMFEGRPFQVEGPAMRKLRLLKQVVSARGTTRSPCSADRSRDRAATVCTGRPSPARLL